MRSGDARQKSNLGHRYAQVLIRELILPGIAISFSRLGFFRVSRADNWLT